MKAVVLEKPGSPDELQFKEFPMPLVTPGHVLVRVGACAVAQRDLVERKGGHPILATPIVQGHEFAGEVVEIGPDVTRWSVADRVVCLYSASCGDCDACVQGDERRCSAITEAYGLTVHGGYAEYALIHERGLAPLLDGLSFEVGSCMLSAIGVGYNNVAHKAAIRPGEVVLVTGASGGVGLAALQTVRLLGAHPWAVTTSESKAKRLEAMGAEVVLIDPGDGFHRAVRKLRPQGVDAVIDCVGSPTLGSSIKATRRYGRIVAVGNIDPSPLALRVGSLVVNAIDLLGSDNVDRKALAEAMTLVREGKIEVVIDRTLPLSAAAEAHRLLEARAVFGRVVLIPGMTG